MNNQEERKRVCCNCGNNLRGFDSRQCMVQNSAILTFEHVSNSYKFNI